MKAHPPESKIFPSLIFLETTVACDYSCRHCRADSQPLPSNDEMSLGEFRDIIDQVYEIWGNRPILVITGGNPLLRSDIKSIISYVRLKGFRFAFSPAASNLLDNSFLKFLKLNRCSSVSLSLDGVSPETHDWLRRKDGSLNITFDLIGRIMQEGLNLQINTTVMSRNILELPAIASLIHDSGISAWEVFFLINTGRGINVDGISPEEYMQVNYWLSELWRYGLNIRTVEGPVFRIIGEIAEKQPSAVIGKTYQILSEKTDAILEECGSSKRKLRSGHTYNHGGTIFISHNGNVYPSGLFNLKLGNLRENSLQSILDRNPEYSALSIREKLGGKCGICEFKYRCGGSRARALYSTGDAFGADPLCLYIPGIKRGDIGIALH